MKRSHAVRHHAARRNQNVKKPVRKLFVDRIIYAVACIEPLFSVPQAYEIFRAHSAVNVSIVTWIGYEAMTAIWVWYSIVHRDKLLLLYQGLFLVIDGSIIVGALIYGSSV